MKRFSTAKLVAVLTLAAVAIGAAALHVWPVWLGCVIVAGALVND